MKPFADPLLRLLPSEVPPEFERMEPAEQAWRGRTFLMTYGLTGSKPMAWEMALVAEPEKMAEMKAIADDADDELIRETVIQRNDIVRNGP